jgi:hypothetical protein
MKLEDARYQYVIMSDTKIGVEDITTGAIMEMAEYYLPSDILHISLSNDYRGAGLASLPALSAARMSALFRRKITAIYMEVF